MQKLIALFLTTAIFLLGTVPALAAEADAALTLPEGEQLAGFAPGSDGAFWLTACRTDDPGPWQLSEGDRMYRSDPDGGLRLVYVREDVDPSPGVSGCADITALCDGGGDAAWLAVEEGYIAGDGMTILFTYDLLRVSADGAVLTQADLSALCPEDGMSLVSLTPYADGGVLALLRGDNGDFLAALDASGNALPAPTLPGTGRTEALVLLADGSIAGCRFDTDALGGEPTGVSLVTLAPGMDTFTAAPLEDLSPAYITDVVAGDGDTVWLLHARTALYAYDRASGQLTEGPDLLDLGVEDLAGAICQDGTLYAAYGDGYRSLSLLPVPMDGGAEPLVLASFYHFSDIEARMVAQYNRAHPDRPVQVRSYAEYDDPLTRFNNDIIAGDVPDMVYLSYMPYDALLKQGLLADLTDFIEADPDIRKGDYVNSMWDAVTVDGAICSVVSRFRVGTFWGAEDGLTAAEFTLDRLEAEAAAGRTVFAFEGGVDSPEARNYLFQDLLLPNLGTFVDFEGPACSFDSPKFIQFLETVGTMSLTGDPLVRDRGYLGQFFLMPGETLLGYPTAAGGTFLFQPDIELAITTAASAPEACWQFVRQFLLEDVQAYTTLADLPVRRDVRDLYALEGYEDGAEAVAAILDGPMTVYRDASRASAVLDIVQEETAAYFAGSITAEDAAATLQSRVGLYLAEQA